MSERLLSHSPDLTRLRNEGYDVRVRASHLIVRHVPYVTPQKNVSYGVLVDPVRTAGDRAAAPADHIFYFHGEKPSRADGTGLAHIIEEQHHLLADGIEVDFRFSSKPPSGSYADYYEKVTTYVSLLMSQARLIDPSVTAQTFPVFENEDEDSPFVYLDTASSRARITVISERLKLGKVAIVGVGGTGSYILDLVAKTPVSEIHLFDGDKFISHNAFRSPGAASLEQLRAEPTKVDYLREAYSKMHRKILAHRYFVGPGDVDELRGFDFVFLAFEGRDKRAVIDRLAEFRIPFVDVGMGIGDDNGALNGILRVTTATVSKHDHLAKRVDGADADVDDEYVTNIQVADLNALNAALAVIKWKKLFGFYADLEHEHHSTYMTDGNTLVNEDKA